MRAIAMLAVVTVAVVIGARPTEAQTILGNRFDLKDRPGVPAARRLTVKAQENASAETVTGDPATNGAVIQLIVNGGTPSSQTIALPAGSRWHGASETTPGGKGVWRYHELASSRVSPLRALTYTRSATGRFRLAATFDSRYVTLDIGAPNPGTYAGMVLTIPSGPTYCVNFGGVAGGVISRNDAVSFRVAKPTAEGTCPSGTPVCGDGIVDGPFETCDVANDAACPGLCGANGLPCLCPFCGDATIDPGESCDGQAHLGSCTEGCSYTCACAVCGDGIVQTPVEDCEPSGSACYSGTCAPVGDPNQCRCPVCGDGQATQGEECDFGDDAACPGLCNPDTCTCAVCGNNVTDYAYEQCDGTDDVFCPGACQPDCTCP